MKKLLLLFIAITAFSCTDEDAVAIQAEPVDNDFDLLHVDYVQRDCFEGVCENQYVLVNEVSHPLNVVVKFKFNRVDGQQNDNNVVLMYAVQGNSTTPVSFITEEQTVVELERITGTIPQQ